MNAHTPRALRAAEIIMNDKHKIRTDYGEKTVYGIADLIETETGLPELLEVLKRARIALTFYREWMSEHCPEGNGSTQYPYGIDVENGARAIIAKAEGRE